jgi:ribosomal protein L5
MGTKSLIDVTVTDFNEIQYDKYDEGSVGYDITFETGLREGTLTFKCH